MLIKTKEYLKEHPCYLVAAITLASKGEIHILKKEFGDDRAAFQCLQAARVFQGLISVHRLADFPIYLSQEGVIIKMPERLAGLVFADRNFWGLKCDNTPNHDYGADWLKKQTKADREDLLAEYERITA